MTWRRLGSSSSSSRPSAQDGQTKTPPASCHITSSLKVSLPAPSPRATPSLQAIWIHSINGLSLGRESLDDVKLLLKGDARGVLELCTWSSPIRHSNSDKINWSMDLLRGFLKSLVIGVDMILLFFRKQLEIFNPNPTVSLSFVASCLL